MVSSLIFEDPNILQFDDALTRLTSEADVINHLTEIVKKSSSAQNPIDKKLAVLYLMDSIMKNIGSPYPELFSNHIFQIFTSSFNEVEGTIVESMKHVFNTWKTFPKFAIFSPELLARIEERMVSIESFRMSFNSGIPISSGWPDPPPDAQQNMQEILEMAVLKDMYIRLHPLKVLPYHDEKFVNKLRFLQNALVTELSLKYELCVNLGLSISGDIPQLLELYHSFQEMKIKLTRHPSLLTDPTSRKDGETPIVQISLKQPKTLNQYNKDALAALYNSRSFQCKQCGMRFLKEKDLGRHLGEFHLRLKLQRESQSVMSYRQWYLSIDDWLEILGGVKFYSKNESNTIERENEVVSNMPEQLQNKVVADDSQTSCAGCGEEFNTLWDHQDQMWYYTDTRRMPDGPVYHMKCYPSSDSTDVNLVNPENSKVNSKKRSPVFENNPETLPDSHKRFQTDSNMD